MEKGLLQEATAPRRQDRGLGRSLRTVKPRQRHSPPSHRIFSRSLTVLSSSLIVRENKCVIRMCAASGLCPGAGFAGFSGFSGFSPTHPCLDLSHPEDGKLHPQPNSSSSRFAHFLSCPSIYFSLPFPSFCPSSLPSPVLRLLPPALCVRVRVRARSPQSPFCPSTVHTITAAFPPYFARRSFRVHYLATVAPALRPRFIDLRYAFLSFP